MAVAATLYGPALAATTPPPPVVIDATGLTTTVPLLIKNAKTLSGLELQVTGTTASGYVLKDSGGTTRGALGYAVSAGEWHTNSAAGALTLTFDSAKVLSFGVFGGARVADWGSGGSTSYVDFSFASTVKLQIAANNSVTSCPLQFVGDPNTGIAQIDGADSVSFVTAGAEIIRCNSAAASTGVTLLGNAAMVAGKVFKIDSSTSLTATPLQFGGGTPDPNTGVSQPGGADTVSLVAGGTETVRVGNGTFGIFTKNAAPAAQQTSGANITNNVTSGGTDDTIANFTDLTTYATDAAAIRNDIYQLARKVKQINDGLRTLGWFT